MGTNFYFKIKSEINISLSIGGEIEKSILEKVKWALDEATEIHIGKRSSGWLPIFEKTEYYSSVEGIKEFYKNNQKHLDIIDEYGSQYSMEKLDEELFGWNKSDSHARRHSDLGRYYYLDNEGYEFSNRQFS